MMTNWTNCVRVLCALVVVQVGALAQSIWSLAATGGPPSRLSFSLAHDTLRGRTVLFGGFTVTVLPGGGFGGLIFFADTWEWDGGAWQQQASTVAPSARYGHAMTFDSVRGRTVLFGGTTRGTGSVGDTWEWDGVSWVLRAASGPAARQGHRVAFDSQRGRVVLFGGSSGSGYFADTWEWDGSTWTSAAATGPAARSDHGLAYDSQRGRIVLFGGTSGPTPTGNGWLGDTWEWNGVAWQQQAPTASPSARYRHAMAFDVARGRTVVFSGDDSTGSPRDTWEWDGSTWTTAATVGPGSFSPMVYDSQHACMVLLEPTTPALAPFNTWKWFDPAPGTASAFGAGCGGPALSLSPDVAAPPTIGATAQALLSNVPSPLAFVAVGWSRTNAGPFLLPVPLDAYGMTGCSMLQSTDVLGQPATSTGTGAATYSLPVPFYASLLGVHVYLQGYAVASGMNPANIILSNGLDWLIGY